MFKNLRTELKKRGISLKEYAEALGITERALPAAVFEALPVRPSRRTLEAAEAALGDVCFVFFGIAT